MNKTIAIVVWGSLASALFLNGACNSANRCPKYPKIPMPPVKAPKGFRWELNKAYCDEFNGGHLNRNKWYDTYPGWEGRVPGRFVPSSISVSDGF